MELETKKENMEENKKVQLRMILAEMLLQNTEHKDIEQCSQIVTQNFNRIENIFTVKNINDELDRLIESVEKKRSHQWRSKINAIGFVKSIANEHLGEP